MNADDRHHKASGFSEYIHTQPTLVFLFMRSDIYKKVPLFVSGGAILTMVK